MAKQGGKTLGTMGCSWFVTLGLLFWGVGTLASGLTGEGHQDNMQGAHESPGWFVGIGVLLLFAGFYMLYHTLKADRTVEPAGNDGSDEDNGPG